MSQSISKLTQSIGLARDIISQTQMQNDDQISTSLAEAEIVLEGLRVHRPDIDERIRGQLLKLHGHDISLKLQQIVRDCLAYYALAEQPLGTNEPPIGPVFAQQLLSRLDDLDLNLMEVKDELHREIEALGKKAV